MLPLAFSALRFIRWLSLPFSLLFLIACSPKISMIPGHAHNDYENYRPLQEALEYGFSSVEADVYLIGDELYISHFPPDSLVPERTLEAMYLEPLREHIDKNEGFVYPECLDPFFLLVDIKSDSVATYNKIVEVLLEYSSMLRIYVNDSLSGGPVRVVISGNRPIERILEDNGRYAGLDGRFGKGEEDLPPEIIPLISFEYDRFFSWDGQGKMKESKMLILKSMIRMVHNQGRMIRFWGIPDVPEVWELLLILRVDLINTDRIEDFSKFYREYSKD